MSLSGFNRNGVPGVTAGIGARAMDTWNVHRLKRQGIYLSCHIDWGFTWRYLDYLPMWGFGGLIRSSDGVLDKSVTRGRRRRRTFTLELEMGRYEGKLDWTWVKRRNIFRSLVMLIKKK